jgi:hypothetical protein
VQYDYGDSANHPARFVIFAQVAKPCIFYIIILLLPILCIIGNCNIAQIVSDSMQYLLKR